MMGMETMSTSAADRSTRPGAVAQIARLVEERKVERRLQAIYRDIPGFDCDRCGDCCFSCCETYFAEFAAIVTRMRGLDLAVQETLIPALVGYELLNLATLDKRCPFLETDDGCLIYDLRPLQCRFFGLYPESEYAEMLTATREQNQEVAKEFKRRYRLTLPKEVLEYDLKQCGQNLTPVGLVEMDARFLMSTPRRHEAPAGTFSSTPGIRKLPGTS